jgi:hypothetical protein
MKTFLLSLTLSIVLVANGNAFEVHSKSRYGFVVHAESDLRVTTPSNHDIVLSEPFQKPNINWNPTGPIQCSWDPTGTYLAIFVPHPRVTDVFVLNLKTLKTCIELTPQIAYPDWYSEAYAVHHTPTLWKDNNLSLSSDVLLRNKTTKPLLQTLTIQNHTFLITPNP